MQRVTNDQMKKWLIILSLGKKRWLQCIGSLHMVLTGSISDVLRTVSNIILHEEELSSK